MPQTCVSDRKAEARVELQAVYGAARRLAGAVRRTPLARAEFLGDAAGREVLLKLECWQRTGSFKVRGAFNAVARLGPGTRSRGVVTASAGNHGQAVALAAREVGVHATVFVPANAPATKQRRIRGYGAELRADAADYDEAERMAHEFARTTGAHFVHAFSAPDVVAGQGTIALELLDERPDIGHVLIPVGGGGLAGGVGRVLKTVNPRIRVTGVQSVETTAMHAALEAGRLVDVPVTPTLADGLAGCTDQAAYELAAAVLDELLLVEEAAIEAAIRQLYLREGVVAEGAGAVAVAALLDGRVPLHGTTAVLVTGGNIDGHALAGILGTEA